MAITFGKTFASELEAAGVSGLPFTWGESDIEYSDRITRAQRTDIEAVIAAHDPNAIPAPTQRELLRATLQSANSVVALRQVILELL